MFLRSLVVALAALAVTSPAAGAAVADSFVPYYDAADGVTVRRDSGGVRYMHFSRKAAKIYRGVAGRKATVACGTVTPEPISGDSRFSTSGFGSSDHKLPRKRSRVYLLDSSDDAELCTIATRRTKRDARCLPNSTDEKTCVRVLVALTDAGRAHVDARSRAIELTILQLAVGLSTVDGQPRLDQVQRMLGPDVVVLEGPDASPPPGKVGYWLQGENLAMAALLQDGRRLFARMDAGVYSTNVPELMGGSDDMFSVFG